MANVTYGLGKIFSGNASSKQLKADMAGFMWTWKQNFVEGGSREVL